MGLKMHPLSKRDAQRLLERLRKDWPSEAIESIRGQTFMLMEVGEEGEALFLVDGEPALVRMRERHLPFVGRSDLLSYFPQIIIDSGAVGPICNGAKVMRPGVKGFQGDFSKGEIVAIKEERHGKFLAVGVSFLGRAEAEVVQKGPIIDNLHHIGDRLWNNYKQRGQ